MSLFTLYNDPTAGANAAPFSAAQARPDKVDFDVWAAAFNGNTVVSGGLVTAQASPNATVQVSAATITVVGTPGVINVAPVTSLTVPSLPPANNRKDLVVANSAGVVSLVSGFVIAAIPDQPNIPANSVVLAVIDTGPSTTVIANSNISSRRIVNPNLPVTVGGTVGGTVGPPISGTWLVGMMWEDSNGVLWSCRTAGTPGSWVAASGQPPGVVPTTRIVAVGHSWLTGFGSSMLDKGLASQLAGATGAAIDNFSINGACIGLDNAGALGNFVWSSNANGAYGWAQVLQEPTFVPKRTAAPRVPNGYIGWIVYGINDVGAHHGDTGNNPRTVWKHALRTVISRMSAAQVYEDSDATVVYGGGTWQAAVNFDYTVTRLGVTLPVMARMNSGNGYRPFPANAATFTITIPADFEGGWVAVGMTAYPNSDALITWSGTASAATGTTTLSGTAYNSAGVNAQRSSTNGIVARFNLVASDAGKTIIGTVSAMSATAVATAAAPGAITHGGATGAITYGYKWVAGNQNGDGIPSTETTTTNAVNPLTGTNTNIIPAPTFPGSATYMKLVRSTAGGTGNSATTGVIALITTSVAVTDTGVAALAYTANTANPLLTGGAFDYWQIEAANPNTGVMVTNICRCLPGGLPQVGGTGGYPSGGYIGYGSLGTTAITAGGTVGATTVTVNYAGLTAAQQATLVAGGIVNLTGGANPTEGYYINAINTGTGVITLSTSATVQQGTVTQSGHTTVAFGYPSDADVANYNTDMQAVIAEFPATVQYVGVDAQVGLNQLQYFSDGLHLNDRGAGIAAGGVAQQIGQMASTLQPFQVASMGRKARRSENVVSLWYSPYGSSWGGPDAAHQSGINLHTDKVINGTGWVNLVDTNSYNVSVTIGAKPGDLLDINVSGIWGSEAVQGFMDAVTWSGSAVINSCSSRSPNLFNGVGSWWGNASVFTQISGSILYPVQPADIASSYGGYYVTINLQVHTSAAGNKTLYMAFWPFYLTVKNLGEPSTTGSL